MDTAANGIKDAETEAEELQATLVALGDELRKVNSKPGKTGLTYAEFKAEYLQKKAKALDQPLLRK